MMREIGFCKGVENYSRHFSKRHPGDAPPCLIDYFPKDFLLFVDESHQTLPQIHAMHNGDKARKQSLVEFGFRLPSAFDNRPLKFEEFYRKSQDFKGTKNQFAKCLLVCLFLDAIIVTLCINI